MMHRPNPDWGTHIPALVATLAKSKGPVLELGMGISSTPLLHALCFDQNKFLLSVDNDPVFTKMFSKYRSTGHHIELIKDWDEILDGKWGVVLVDHKPDERRAIEAKKFTQSEFVILHDSEPAHNDLYHYDQVYPLFKYRFDYKKASVHATVLSNFHELDFLHNP